MTSEIRGKEDLSLVEVHSDAQHHIGLMLSVDSENPKLQLDYPHWIGGSSQAETFQTIIANYSISILYIYIYLLRSSGSALKLQDAYSAPNVMSSSHVFTASKNPSDFHLPKATSC